MSSTVAQFGGECNRIDGRRVPIFGATKKSDNDSAAIAGLITFLIWTLPAEGPGRLFAISSGRPWTNRNGELRKAQPSNVEFFDDIDDMARRIIQLDRAGHEVWYSPAAYDAELVERDQATIGPKGTCGTGRKNHCVVALRVNRQAKASTVSITA